MGLVILSALERGTQISLLGQMIKCCQIARTTEPPCWLSELNNLAFTLPVQSCVSTLFARNLSKTCNTLLLVCASRFHQVISPSTYLLSLALFLLHILLILRKLVDLRWTAWMICVNTPSARLRSRNRNNHVVAYAHVGACDLRNHVASIESRVFEEVPKI